MFYVVVLWNIYTGCFRGNSKCFMWWYYGIYIQGVSGGVVNVLCNGIMEYIYRVFQEE